MATTDTRPAASHVPSPPPRSGPRFDLWRVLLSIRVVLALVLSVVAAARWGRPVQRVAAGGEGAEAVVAEPQPAQPVTIDEISLHPSRMPRTADYTRYEKGEYTGIVERTGPITQEVHFEIREGVAEVVPGTTMDYWTFDGAIPGPMLRARVGDTIDFSLHNPEGSSMPHNVDFHAVTGPGGGAVSLDAAPGATSELRVKMLSPGVYVYHCAFPDIPMHISHGMYGLIVVEPEAGLPEVDHEFYLMQSEFYTDRGGSTSAAKLRDAGHLSFSGEAGNLEDPTFVTFNGRPDAVTGDRAIGVLGEEEIRDGESMRLFVGDIGPNLVSSFHVIGEIFDRVYVEGSFDLVNRNVQSTLIPSGGAVAVELTADVAGDYLAVDHAIFRVHKGAVAAIHVGGETDPEVYDPISSSDVR